VPARAMILGAGLGTRLRPLTDELPKPLVPVGDGPALAQVAARLAAAGIREAVLNAYHLAAAFTPARLAPLPLRVEVLREAEVLGTAGAVANAAPLLVGGDVVVWNGDIVAEVDVAALFEAHAGLGAEATLCVAPRGAGEGTVGIGDDGRVVRLRGERTGSEAHGGDFLGVQVLGAALRRSLPRIGCLVGDAYMPALRRGARIATFAVTGAWDDIGTVAAYLAANTRWLARTGVEAWVGQGAEVASGVTLAGSVVGAGAVVSGAGAIRGSVIWPGARAQAPLDEAVVTTGGRLVRRN
jgi:mannose-1-phosphate guanylyltransferase